MATIGRLLDVFDVILRKMCVTRLSQRRRRRRNKLNCKALNYTLHECEKKNGYIESEVVSLESNILHDLHQIFLSIKSCYKIIFFYRIIKFNDNTEDQPL